MSNVVPADTGLLLGSEISMHARPRCPSNKPPMKPLGLVLQCAPHVSGKSDPKPTHKHDCRVAAPWDPRDSPALVVPWEAHSQPDNPAQACRTVLLAPP